MIKAENRALILATVGMAAAFVVWGVMAPLASQLQQVYELSNTQISILLATPVVLGAILRIPMGLLTDRFGGRVVYTFLFLFLVIPLLFLGLSQSFSSLLFWAFWLGFAGTSFAVSIAYVTRWFPPENQGLVLGIAGLGNLGISIANFGIPKLAERMEIGQIFWSLIPLVLVMAVVMWIWAGKEPRAAKPKSISGNLKVMKEERMVWILSFFYFLTFGGFVAFSLYLPKLYIDLFELTKADAGLRAATFGLIATAARPVGGYLADKYGGKQILNFVFAVALGIAIALLFPLDLLTLTTLSFILAIFLGLGNGAVFKLVAQYFPENTGLVTGIVGAAGGLGGFFPPLVMGLSKDYLDSYILGFGLLALYALGAFLTNIVLLRKERA